MPFAENRGGVSPLPQKLRKCLLSAIECVEIGPLTIHVTVFPRENASAAGGAYGIRAVVSTENRPLPSDAVYIGGLVYFGTVSADGLDGMIIAEQENNVWLRGSAFGFFSPANWHRDHTGRDSQKREIWYSVNHFKFSFIIPTLKYAAVISP